MSYSDFRKLFNKLFVCIDFPPSFVGVKFADCWSKEESGGIPVSGTKEEMMKWAKNPQYYMSLEKDSTVMISLLQQDGRLSNSKFPYPDSTRKTCLIISRCSGRQKLTKFDNDNVVNISAVRQHRENSIYITLPKGEYIISACTFKPGDVGTFVLEIYFEDSFVDTNYDETNFLQKLKSTKIERLGDPETKVQVSLKKETNPEDLQQVKEKKQNFIYNHFKNMLTAINQKESDPNVKTEESNKRKAAQKKLKDEDDYDEF
jgi:hypothetical protein